MKSSLNNLNLEKLSINKLPSSINSDGIVLKDSVVRNSRANKLSSLAPINKPVSPSSSSVVKTKTIKETVVPSSPAGKRSKVVTEELVPSSPAGRRSKVMSEELVPSSPAGRRSKVVTEELIPSSSAGKKSTVVTEEIFPLPLSGGKKSTVVTEEVIPPKSAKQTTIVTEEPIVNCQTPKIGINPCNKEESLMKIANKLPPLEIKTNVFAERDKALPLNNSISKFTNQNTTSEFSTFEGVLQNADIEKCLLEKGFIPTEKILTKDNCGNITCRFIKARDKMGRAFYVELDCDWSNGMGFVVVNPTDQILTESENASVIPYSLKVGTFEANSENLYGVGFECNNSFCVMARKDPSLKPTETVFTYTKDCNGQDLAIQENHPVPFPIVKMTEIVANPAAVKKNITAAHKRMRQVTFASCMKDLDMMRQTAKELGDEIENFDKISKEVSTVLECTIGDLEKMSDAYDNKVKTEKDYEKIRMIQFNLQKRNDLMLDHAALCHSMRERAVKLAAIKEEIKSLNEYSKTLFTGLKGVFSE
jgi:hypothetical protein